MIALKCLYSVIVMVCDFGNKSDLEQAEAITSGIERKISVGANIFRIEKIDTAKVRGRVLLNNVEYIVAVGVSSLRILSNIDGIDIFKDVTKIIWASSDFNLGDEVETFKSILKSSNCVVSVPSYVRYVPPLLLAPMRTASANIVCPFGLVHSFDDSFVQKYMKSVDYKSFSRGALKVGKDKRCFCKRLFFDRRPIKIVGVFLGGAQDIKSGAIVESEVKDLASKIINKWEGYHLLIITVASFGVKQKCIDVMESIFSGDSRISYKTYKSVEKSQDQVNFKNLLIFLYEHNASTIFTGDDILMGSKIVDVLIKNEADIIIHHRADERLAGAEIANQVQVHVFPVLSMGYLEKNFVEDLEKRGVDVFTSTDTIGEKCAVENIIISDESQGKRKSEISQVSLLTLQNIVLDVADNTKAIDDLIMIVQESRGAFDI